MSFRPGPADLRASDSDRERVASLLGEAASDGRLTLAEHSDRIERAYSARTLRELAALTADLAAPAAQPIRVDSRRAVTGIFGSDRRDGRWVVPARLVVTAICGTVTLDLREALLPSGRVTILATMLAGQLELLVPGGVAVEATGPDILSRTRIRGGPLPPAGPGIPVIEVRTMGAGARLTIMAPPRRRPRRGFARFRV